MLGEHLGEGELDRFSHATTRYEAKMSTHARLTARRVFVSDVASKPVYCSDV